MRRRAVSIPVDGAQAAHVTLEVAIGQLRLAGGARPGLLLEGTLELPDGVELDERCTRRDGLLHCALSTRFEQHNPRSLRRGPRWELPLAPGVALRLGIEVGASQCLLDLSELQLTELAMQADVGKSEVVLPASGQPRACLKSGVGETLVKIPDAMAARVRMQSGIGSIKVDGRFPRQGNAHQSAGYDTAAQRVDLRIEAGLGSIAVRSNG